MIFSFTDNVNVMLTIEFGWRVKILVHKLLSIDKIIEPSCLWMTMFRYTFGDTKYTAML